MTRNAATMILHSLGFLVETRLYRATSPVFRTGYSWEGFRIGWTVMTNESHFDEVVQLLKILEYIISCLPAHRSIIGTCCPACAVDLPEASSSLMITSSRVLKLSLASTP